MIQALIAFHRKIEFPLSIVLDFRSPLQARRLFYGVLIGPFARLFQVGHRVHDEFDEGIPENHERHNRGRGPVQMRGHVLDSESRVQQRAAHYTQCHW